MSGQQVQPIQPTFFAPAQTPRPKLSDAVIEAEFEEVFWPAWRAKFRRPNMAKDNARTRAFPRARRQASLADIMDGVARFKAAPDPTFRPMASSWLNGGGWKEEPEPDLSLDAWGIDEWTSTTPDDGTLSATCYDRDALDWIMLATGWPPTWRGDLTILGAWLREGYRPESIASVVRECVTESGARASLKAFDGRVRAKAARLDTATFHYR